MKFKAGDVVKIIEAKCYGACNEAGARAVVLRAQDLLDAEYYDVLADTKHTWSFQEKHLALYDEPTAPVSTAVTPACEASAYWVLYTDDADLSLKSFTSDNDRAAWIGQFTLDNLGNKDDFEILMTFCGEIEVKTSEIRNGVDT